MNIYILITGLLRLNKRFLKTLNDMEKNGRVLKVIFVTWVGEPRKMKNLSKFKKLKILECSKLKDNGDGNHKAQNLHYRTGLKYIKSISGDSEDYYILKTRTDVYINPHFLNNIANFNYKINNGKYLNYKLWVPWAHIQKPFYLEDAIFYSHKETMEKLIYSDKSQEKFIRNKIAQGISHVRRFFPPFIEYNKEFTKIILENKDNVFKMSQKKQLKAILNNESGKLMIRVYREILKKYFIVYTKNKDSIVFRPWNTMNHKNNKKINLILTYNNLPSNKTLKGYSKFNVELKGNVIVKTSPNNILWRLKNEIKKQQNFDTDFYNIKTPSILKEINNGFQMSYIENELLDILLTKNILKYNFITGIKQYFLKSLINTTEENIFDLFVDKYNKTYNICSNKKFMKDNKKFIESNLKFKNKLIKLKNTMIVPLKYCHGDLTLSNILYESDEIYFIDFLDNFANTILQDMSKIRQDTQFKLIMEMNNIKNANMTKNLNILDSAFNELFSEYPFYNKYYNYFQFLSLMRILPYCDNINLINKIIKNLNIIILTID